MDKPKFWIIRSSSRSLYNCNTILGIALTKIEAEFKAQQYEKEFNSKHCVPSDFLYTWGINCYVEETSLINFVDKNSKEFKKFMLEKAEEVKKQIKKNDECKEKDIINNVELEKELQSYLKNA